MVTFDPTSYLTMVQVGGVRAEVNRRRGSRSRPDSVPDRFRLMSPTGSAVATFPPARSAGGGGTCRFRASTSCSLISCLKLVDHNLHSVQVPLVQVRVRHFRNQTRTPRKRRRSHRYKVTHPGGEFAPTRLFVYFSHDVCRHVVKRLKQFKKHFADESGAASSDTSPRVLA